PVGGKPRPGSQSKPPVPCHRITSSELQPPTSPTAVGGPIPRSACRRRGWRADTGVSVLTIAHRS
ncbi:MAG: hypothetical protein OEU92_29230, partial [Alphaproteobacteria bacterium]|nr:hypothetical protein [Alphaproteobacteria bacterium]